MKRHATSRIVEGEIYGAPVPGGWPGKGPFRVLSDGLARVFGRRMSSNRGAAASGPEGEESDPSSLHPDPRKPEE